jgi:cytochrome P450
MGTAFKRVIAYISQLGSGAGILHQVLPTSKRRAYQQASTRLVAYAGELVRERRRQATRPDDVLTRLIEATEAADHRLRDEEMIAQVLTLWYAGHETQTLALTWAWYEVATHPEVEAALLQELATVLQGRAPTLADVPRLVYTLQIFKEVLRLHPPAWLFPREVTTRLDVGGSRLDEGTLVMACPHLTHRLSLHWPDPEQFRPERFAPSGDTSHAPYAYYPFGIGQRTCLGQPFATQEFLLVLAVLAQRFQLRPLAGFVPQVHAAGALRLRNGMPMTVQPRAALAAPGAGRASPATRSCPVHPTR